MRKFIAHLLLLVLLNSLGFYYLTPLVADVSQTSIKIILKIRVYIQIGNSILQTNGSAFGVYIDNNFYEGGAEIDYPYNEHRITAVFPAGYSFVRWGSSPDIQISNVYSPNTTALFTGNVYVIEIIDGKAYAFLNLILNRNIETFGDIRTNITLINAINNKSSDIFLPLEKIKIQTKITIDLIKNGIFGNGKLNIYVTLLTSKPILKRTGSSLQAINYLEYNRNMSFSSTYLLDISFTFPENNYELGLPNSTGKLDIYVTVDVKITTNGFNSRGLSYTFKSYQIIQVNIMSVKANILKIQEDKDFYIINFILYWSNNSSIVKNKENIISINLKNLKISSEACNADGYVSFYLNKTTLEKIMKGFYGELEFYPQFSDGGYIPFSSKTKLPWSLIASILMSVKEENITVKIVKLIDFTPIANASVILLADDLPIYITTTNSQGIANIFIKTNTNYNILKIKIIINEMKEILIESQYSDIIIYTKYWP